MEVKNYVQEVMNRVKDGETGKYKPVDERTVSLTEAEKEATLKEALYKKIAAINSANYLKAVSHTPTYTIPNNHDLYDALVNELMQNKKWVIDQYNSPVIEALSLYFSNDLDFEKLNDNFSLSKGLLLVGPIGCGKTSLLQLLSKNPFKPFTVVSCRTVASEYAEHGHPAIAHYSTLRQVSKREWFGHDHVGYCFDDIGTEELKKNFGNQINVMGELILNIYDSRDAVGKVHLTTNLSAEDMLNNYGSRVGSRINEMFNVIIFSDESPDRRG